MLALMLPSLARDRKRGIIILIPYLPSQFGRKLSRQFTTQEGEAIAGVGVQVDPSSVGDGG